MNESTISRRSFLKLSAVTGASFLIAGCTSSQASGELSLIDRILGRPRTGLPSNGDAWRLENGTLTLDLQKLPEMSSLGSAVRIEGDALPDPVLVVLGDDGDFYAFKNACTHAGRRIDPLTGTMTLECCSVSSSTFNYQGEVLSGPAEEPLYAYPVSQQDGYLRINLN